MFAVGGDGTVRACAQALAGTQVPLAIVPRGTANLVATALGIPSSLGAALAVGFGPHERRIDLALADSLTFVAMAGIGLDAAVVGATASELKGAAGWLGYAATGVRHLAGARTHFEVDASTEASPWAAKPGAWWSGTSACCPAASSCSRRPGPTTGCSTWGSSRLAGPLGWPRVGWRVLTRSRHDDVVLERYQARRVEIAAEAQLPRQADGELHRGAGVADRRPRSRWPASARSGRARTQAACHSLTRSRSASGLPGRPPGLAAWKRGSRLFTKARAASR